MVHDHAAPVAQYLGAIDNTQCCDHSVTNQLEDAGAAHRGLDADAEDSDTRAYAGLYADDNSIHTGVHACDNRGNTDRDACDNQGNIDRDVRDTHSVTDPGTVDSDLHPALTASPDRMPREFPVEPQVRGNDSDQVQVGSPGFREDLFGVLLVLSPDVRSEFGSAIETASGYGSIQSVEISLPHPDGRHSPVHGASESKYCCVARGQLTVVFNLEVQDRQVLLPGPCLWRHTAHFLEDLWDLNQGAGSQS